ncbi:winged helix-turn-helix domain-containing protein [Silvimonas iriomotensis]|uniref:Winged helix-turn-helix domain-containing protein n=1 Tax=Silvimonas iriomotensis TaxID=449662 RepID=A0ABQ2PCZ3_9NEIS|nr:winged helix-turn-helix domain-containing protein [Silvimonas iriomotensis]GGP23413.1 hypothetical protein GCM10010970_34130 [Silvimonas iriomotensis]
MHTLSLTAARTLHLNAQGLLTPPRRKAVKADVLTAISRMAQLQIDTISVVARSPYLVLFSRLGAYDQAWLEQLLAERRLFEYWSHEACFLPIEDYGLMRHRMLDPSGMGWKYAANWHQQYQSEIDALIGQIRASGPVRSADFAREQGSSNGWWDWKPEKRHLEVLFTTGELMVSERRNFHRVYDLTERVLPDWNDARDLPDLATVQRELIRRSCQALGVVRADWVADYYRLRKVSWLAELAALEADGEIVPVTVPGFKQATWVHRDQAGLIEAANAGEVASSVTTLLSPFDPVVWDRKRATALFGFDYTLECYTPAPKRKYGYFCLPILSRGKLVGRLDAKAHRARGVFEIKSLYLEDGVRLSARLAGDIGRAIQRCADWHATPQVTWGKVPAAFMAQSDD